VDLITHMAAGALAGGCVALMIRGAAATLSGAVAWGAIGGALPDVDAVTRVPGFDQTIGLALGLQPGGVIYGGSEWYSHHHFTHSLVAAVGAALLLAGLAGLERLVFGGTSDGRRIRRIWLAPVCMAAGYLLHLVGDLVTPASVWGGIQLLWPAEGMVGGWGWAWWFNNYDIFLMQLVGLLAMALLSLLPRSMPVLARALPGAVLVGVLAVCFGLLRARVHDYAYTGDAPDYWALEERSLEEQRRLLPSDLYQLMHSLDDAILLPF
jgi:inner membrane protein